MTKDLNEDLIEATIRRVAEAKAAQAAATRDEPAVSEAVEAAPEAAVEAGSDAIEPAGPAAPDVDEDRIAATMRRVAEARSAMTSSAADEPVPDEHLEARTNGAVDTGAATRDAPPASLPQVDEDRIEATIRRVAAAREAQARAAQAQADAEAPPESLDPPTPLPARPTILPPAADGDGWEQAVADLRRELDETRRELRALARRLDSAEARADAGRPDRMEPPPAANDGDDDWDEAPQLPRIPIGQAPRPAIFYDPSPQTATAEHLQPEPDDLVDTPVLPKPLPPLHAEPKRGLDLLPRTYRITVEDKRRGVDLVPLHRALLGMDGVRDMSLLSYSNGVAIVSIEMVDELDPGALEGAVARAMARSAKVEVHNDTTMVVKLAEE
ncbi:MAG: hypothetical protein HY874_10625 [Chloroflexi bacterium]|nr:hypothetical protein [Chloroflexota bacterium]